MKRILALALLLLTFTAGSAFAAPATVAQGALIGAEGVGGYKVYGGVDDDAATGATNPLVTLSTGVQGVVNTNDEHSEYTIITKHISGSKYFGTANDSTNIYWKQSAKGDLNTTTAGTVSNNGNFGEGWTAY